MTKNDYSYLVVVFSFFDKDVWCEDHADNHDDNNKVEDHDDENHHDDDGCDDEADDNDDSIDYSSDGGNEKNFPLPPDWAAPRQSLPPSPSFQVGDEDFDEDDDDDDLDDI